MPVPRSRRIAITFTAEVENYFLDVAREHEDTLAGCVRKALQMIVDEDKKLKKRQTVK